MKWALVLSGGGAKGVAHVGVIKAIYQMGLRPDLIGGVSMGALVGGVHASGMAIEDIESYFLYEFDVRKYLDGWSYKLPRLPFLRFLQAGEAMGNVVSQPGMDSGKGVRQELERLTGGKHFEDCRIPFRCSATDMIKGERVTFSAGPLMPALYSSMAYPGVFAPYPWGKRVFSDGAVINNLPVFLAREEGIRKVLAVNVTPFLKVDPSEMNSALGVALRAFDISHHHRSLGPEDRPSLQLDLALDESGIDFTHTDNLIRAGEETVLSRHRQILRTFGSLPQRLRIPGTIGKPPSIPAPSPNPKARTASAPRTEASSAPDPEEPFIPAPPTGPQEEETDESQ